MNFQTKAAGLCPTAFKLLPINRQRHINKEPAIKPLPPYSSTLSVFVSENNDIYLFAGHHAWEYARGFYKKRAVLALPLRKNPADYRWPVSGRSILVFDCAYLSKQPEYALETDYIRKLAHRLLQAKATVVRVIYFDSALYRYGG